MFTLLPNMESIKTTLKKFKQKLVAHPTTTDGSINYPPKMEQRLVAHPSTEYGK